MPSPSVVDGETANRGRPLALYVHIPFCERKCHYCDFNSGVSSPETRERYVLALLREIRDTPFAGREAGSVFFGGGTPSVLSAGSLTCILDALRGVFPFTGDAEITVECNPGTVASERMAGETTASFLGGLRDAGVNRLSFGVQSFEPELLKRLGRIHSPEQAIESVEQARRVGFENINVDLMFAIPGQTLLHWERTLQQALELGVPHLSAYSLIVEPDTPFAMWDASGSLARPDQDLEADMYQCAIETLRGAGYEHYEVSAFARPGARCRQNETYWRNEEYIGFGNGAASYLAGERITREAALESYVRLAETGMETIAGRERLDRRGAMAETMMMGLRLLDGVSRPVFVRRFGIDPAIVYESELAALGRDGLLEFTADAIRLTPLGLFLANEVWEAFV